MVKTTTAALLALLFCTVSYANDYDDAWNAIRKKDYNTAKTLLVNATKNPATGLDAYITLSFLQTYRG